MEREERGSWETAIIVENSATAGTLERVLFEGPRHQSQRRRTLEPNREEERGRKDRDLILAVSRSMLDRGKVAVQDGTQREEQDGGAWEGGTRKRLHRQGWSVLV